ncbi:MAG: DNA-binding Lrp family transcriptional regulator [Candidatus Azotimanducaceae bacterium]|jgi:DNA-binding Lrp family transcriptional regulator|tara:strand:+ start:1296 stop:1583 length:288 start_codon:yes stop_codon:yes gene_type:complete
MCWICQQGGKQTGATAMSTCVFIQIRCKPGTTYKVAEEIALLEIHSELYSTSGDFDLMMKIYIPDAEDVGKFINDNLLMIVGIERSLTTMTYKVF